MVSFTRYILSRRPMNLIDMQFYFLQFFFYRHISIETLHKKLGVMQKIVHIFPHAEIIFEKKNIMG